MLSVEYILVENSLFVGWNLVNGTLRQLNDLGIQGTASIPMNVEGELDRKAIKIKRYSVIGFGLEVANLSEENSLKLQEHGLGGKRLMGCGIFEPMRGLT